MADFLSRLLDRARGDAPTLQRRAAQLFEPAAAGAMLGMHEPPSSLSAADVELVDRRSAPPSAAPVAPPTAPPASPSPASRVERDVGPPARPDADRHEPRSRSRGEPTTDASFAPIARPRPTPSLMEAVAFVTAAPRPAPRVPTADDRPATARVGSRSPAEPTRTPDSPRRVVREDAAAASTRDRAPAAAPGPSAPFAPLPSRTSPVPTAVGRRAPDSTIHVTIGRIEVRAVPATQAAPRRSAGPAAPRLTLEAYLRSRTGGER